MKICLSSTSSWFLLCGVALGVAVCLRLINLFWGFLFRLRFQKSIKKKKHGVRNKKRALIKANDSDSLLKEGLIDDSEKEVCVEPFRQFTYQSLADATQDFNLDCRINYDNVGEVFTGQIIDAKEVVAIRRVNENPPVCPVQFFDQALLLSQVIHPNLAMLIGYCEERYRRFLVYKFVNGGTLHNRLHDSETCLDWSMRMKIALGVARALEHLQSMVPPILHCYIEPSNIWLDEECTPKLSAFGLVGMYTHPLAWIGSYYYSMPDYLMTKTISCQTDIHGFGSLMLELITGRKGIFRGGGPRNLGVFLTDWALPYLKDKENLAEIVDPKLRGKVGIEEILEACNIAEMCLQKQPESRPLITDLVTKMNQLVYPRTFTR